MHKQHKTIKQYKQQHTTTNAYMAFYIVLCFVTCGIVGNKKKAKQNKHRDMDQPHKNKQHKQQHTTTNTYMFLFGLSLCLLCPLLTYRGICGIVGNKKSTTRQTHKT